MFSPKGNTKLKTKARARPLTTLSQCTLCYIPKSIHFIMYFYRQQQGHLRYWSVIAHFISCLYLRFHLHLSKVMSRKKTQSELLIKTCPPIPVSISSLNQSQRARAYIRKCVYCWSKSRVELCGPIIAFRPAQTGQGLTIIRGFP